MRRLLLALVLSVSVTSIPTVAVAATAGEGRQPSSVRLDGVDVRLRPGAGQVVTTNRTSGYHARITLWARTPDGWQVRMRSNDGRIGYGGLVAGPRRRQGTGTTPLGTYDLRWAFGTHKASRSWDIGYRRIKSGDFWVQDNESDFYNRYRNKRAGGFRWWLPSSDPNSSERLTDYKAQYEWSLVTSFNRQQVRQRGSGIFLHVNGSGATAGCVSAPRWFIRSLVGRLNPDKNPVIAVGR